MLIGAVWDVAPFEIPDSLSILLAALGGVIAVASSESLLDVGLRAASAFGVFAVGAFLFARNAMGGGDIKMFAAAALWFAPFDMLHFLLAASLLGGALALTLFGLRWLFAGCRATAPAWLERLLDPASKIPYGVALGGGGLILIARTTAVVNLFATA